MEGLQVGRNVHYVVAENEHRVAFISKIWSGDGVVNLSYVNDWSYDLQFGTQPLVPATSVRYSDGHEQHTWHWIEKA